MKKTTTTNTETNTAQCSSYLIWTKRQKVLAPWAYRHQCARPKGGTSFWCDHVQPQGDFNSHCGWDMKLLFFVLYLHWEQNQFLAASCGMFFLVFVTGCCRDELCVSACSVQSDRREVLISLSGHPEDNCSKQWQLPQWNQNHPWTTWFEKTMIHWFFIFRHYLI